MNKTDSVGLVPIFFPGSSSCGLEEAAQELLLDCRTSAVCRGFQRIFPPSKSAVFARRKPAKTWVFNLYSRYWNGDKNDGITVPPTPGVRGPVGAGVIEALPGRMGVHGAASGKSDDAGAARQKSDLKNEASSASVGQKEKDWGGDSSPQGGRKWWLLGEGVDPKLAPSHRYTEPIGPGPRGQFLPSVTPDTMTQIMYRYAECCMAPPPTDRVAHVSYAITYILQGRENSFCLFEDGHDDSHHLTVVGRSFYNMLEPTRLLCRPARWRGH